MLASMLLLSSCGSMKNTATVSKTVPVGQSSKKNSDNKGTIVTDNLHPLSVSMLEEASTWLGTPYKYGGNDKSGVDCSGFVLKVYLNALNIKLPRTSSDIATYCTPIKEKELLPGDLLFFATTNDANKVSHVGMYIGDNRMIHASSSKGVIVSDIMADYFRRTFIGAGCVSQYRTMIKSRKQETVVEEIKAFEFVPVESLPEKKEHKPSAQKKSKAENNKKNKKSETEIKAKTPLKAVVIGEINGYQEKSADNARDAVLKNLIEHKLDSIF